MSDMKPEHIWGEDCKAVELREFLYGRYHHPSGKYDLLYTHGSWSDNYELFRVDKSNDVYHWITTEHGWNKRICNYDAGGNRNIRFIGKEFGLSSLPRPSFTDDVAVMDWVKSEQIRGNSMIDTCQ